MIVFLNGKFVPECEAMVSVFDRGFLYGDGLFEAVPLFNGIPFRWEDHLERLSAGARFIGIKIPCSAEQLRLNTSSLIEQNKFRDGLLRITVTRGIGLRGYSPKGADTPTLAMSLHPMPNERDIKIRPRWKLKIASQRLHAENPLNGLKTSNKLLQILARAEADEAGCDEALLLNSKGFVAECSSGNIFWIRGGTVFTPPLEAGILPGVTRKVILELCRKHGYGLQESNATLDELIKSDGIFATSSSRGVVEISQLDDINVALSDITAQLANHYGQLVVSECRVS